ncbi:hypothetical protein [Pontibacter kalidii]|uniref:hypothetical protein n=1 Tax=Pontibacter kalidii TaxID=2592049 RepID=UPI0022598206|nr:hypothetical protein [Pontibacter kalidii]
MRRHRRYGGLGISDTWNYTLSAISDSLGFTRDYTDRVSPEMIDNERIARKHRLEREQKQDEEQTYPSCPLNDRPEEV